MKLEELPSGLSIQGDHGSLSSAAAAQGVASPADPSPPSTATPPRALVARPPGIVLTFENADIEAVIQAVSELVGFNYVLAPDVRGKVTVRTSGAIRRETSSPSSFRSLKRRASPR